MAVEDPQEQKSVRARRIRRLDSSPLQLCNHSRVGRTLERYGGRINHFGEASDRAKAVKTVHRPSEGHSENRPLPRGSATASIPYPFASKTGTRQSTSLSLCVRRDI